MNSRELQDGEIAGLELPDHFTRAEKKRLAQVRHLSADECDRVARKLTEMAMEMMNYAAWLRERKRALARTAFLGRN